MRTAKTIEIVILKTIEPILSIHVSFQDDLTINSFYSSMHDLKMFEL